MQHWKVYNDGRREPEPVWRPPFKGNGRSVDGDSAEEGGSRKKSSGRCKGISEKKARSPRSSSEEEEEEEEEEGKEERRRRLRRSTERVAGRWTHERTAAKVAEARSNTERKRKHGQEKRPKQTKETEIVKRRRVVQVGVEVAEEEVHKAAQENEQGEEGEDGDNVQSKEQNTEGKGGEETVEDESKEQEEKRGLCEERVDEQNKEQEKKREGGEEVLEEVVEEVVEEMVEEQSEEQEKKEAVVEESVEEVGEVENEDESNSEATVKQRMSVVDVLDEDTQPLKDLTEEVEDDNVEEATLAARRGSSGARTRSTRKLLRLPHNDLLLFDVYEDVKDTPAFTANRKANAEKRHSDRLRRAADRPDQDPHKLPGNVEFVADFLRWYKRLSTVGSAAPEQQCGYLFRRDDGKSLLRFLIDKYGNDFRLSQLLAFADQSGGYKTPPEAEEWVFSAYPGEEPVDATQQ